MSTPVQTVHRDDGVFDTTQAMQEARVRRLPVVGDDGTLLGPVTLDDNLIGGIKSQMEVK